jgi:hypothetical protein
MRLSERSHALALLGADADHPRLLGIQLQLQRHGLLVDLLDLIHRECGGNRPGSARSQPDAPTPEFAVHRHNDDNTLIWHTFPLKKAAS